MSALLERHWDKWVAAPNGCFIWCASYKDSGYPQVYTKERPRVFTQMICEETHGARTSFLLLDASHTCCNRQCVRPEHVIWETRAENEKRKTAEAKAAGACAALAVMRDAGSFSERAQKTWATRSRNTPPFCMHKGFYRVRVTIGGVRHFIGDFSTAEAAVAARENFLKRMQK